MARPARGDGLSDEVPHSGLTARIILGMVLGLAAGVVLNLVGTEGALGQALVEGVFYVVGAIFIASLKLLVVPLVFVSLVCGTAALDDVSKLGRVGGKTLGLYLATTAIAISVALALAIAVAPGAGFDLPTGLSYASC
jgi:Na+/H+-dicarboxylate symporter